MKKKNINNNSMKEEEEVYGEEEVGQRISIVFCYVVEVVVVKVEPTKSVAVYKEILNM